MFEGKRILLISHEMTFTGAPNSLLNMARLLKSKGHIVSVMTLKSGKFSAEFEKLGFSVGIVSVNEFDYYLLHKRFDIVIANTVFCGEFALKAQFFVKTYLYIREGENLKDIIKNCGLKDEYVRLAQNIICVSEYSQNYIEKNFMINGLKVIHNFLYEDEYVLPRANISKDGKIHFLIAATVEERKGISIALEAVKMLPKKVRKKTVLHIAGRKPLWSKDYWKNLDFNAENIKYHGEISDKLEMDRLYDSINVVTIPSFDEACSLTALEGAKHGKALIVTENVGAKYMVKGNGLVVKTGSSKDLSQAFEYMVECGKLEEMGNQSFENFLNTSTKDIYYANFLNVIGEEKFMNGKEINVCFISDSGYVMPTAVAITSLCFNSDRDTLYNIFVIMPKGASYNPKSYFLECTLGYENISINIIEADISDLENLHLGEDTRYLVASTTALLKFKLAELFFDLDKILYLDGDIIVRTDISELYDYDLKDNYVAAVRDLPQVLYDNQQMGAEISGSDYFNSGVMLLNLKKMRQKGIKEKLIETKRSYADQSLMDQNIFNIVFKGRVLQLPFIYNACYINLIESSNRYTMERLNKIYGTSYNNPYEILPDIKIMHFSSKLKPWYFYDVPLADEWLFYYKKSAMRNVKIQRTFHTERNVDMVKVKEQVKKLSETYYDDKKKVIPIAFAGNEQYLLYAAVAIQSIYENSNPNTLYDINILMDASLSDNMKCRLNAIKYPNVRITLWDVRNSFNGIDIYSVGHYSKQMYYRWLIPEVLSMYDKVIYLDCDLIVEKDISNLYDISIGNNYVGAVNNFLRDSLYSHVNNRLKLDPSQYYNSGVLTMNCRAWINRQLKKRCIKSLASYGKLPCPDQDVLNIVCKGNIFRLNDKWNFQWHHQFREVTKGEFMLDYQRRFASLKYGGAWIIHYTSQIKPWNHPEKIFAEIFWKYCRSTVFYETILFENIKAIIGNGGKKSVEKCPKSLKQKEIEQLKNHLTETKKSFTYKLARFVSWFPRKVKGYDYTPVCSNRASEDKQLESLRQAVFEIHNSKSFKLAYKLTALPRKIREIFISKK